MSADLKGKVSENVLKEISREFYRLHGKNALCLSIAHLEKHPHIHLVFSGTDLSGRSSRISKGKFESLKKGLDRYLEINYPSLHKGISLNEKKSFSKEQLIEKAIANRQINKAKLIREIQEVYKSSISKDDFINQLSKDGHEIYYRNGRLQGIVFEGKKYRLAALGYDNQIIQKLDHQNKAEQNTLMELGALRNGNREQKQEQEKKLEEQFNEAQSVDYEIENELNELSMLRSGAEQEREIEFHQPSLFDELESSFGILENIAEAPSLLSLPLPKNIIPIGIGPDS